MDILSAISDLKDFRLESRSLAFFADQLHIGEELHFHHDGSVSLASLAAPSWNIEREVSCGESALMRFRSRRKQITNPIESLYVGDRIRPRRSSDGRLVDQNSLVDVLGP